MKDVSVQVVTLQVTWKKTWETFIKFPWRQTKYDGVDYCQVKPLTWNITVTCKGDLNMHQMPVNFVPWLLTDEEKQWQFLASKNMLVVTHLPYLLEFIPFNSFLFLRMKLQL
jgi:hypothetical protein